jgi:NAD(P)-dependent dehydrogenase (short-subunit alcohol dehydrogenase family)
MLQDKVVVITGGAGLLGKEFSKSVIKEHGKVIIADINEESANSFILEINELYPNSSIMFHYLDITSKDSIETLINNVSKKYGKINAWVNNAYPKIKSMNSNTKREYSNSFFDVNYNDFCESVSINVGSVFLCSQRISSLFIGQGFGNIINISSIYGLIAPRFEVYEGTGMTMPVDYAVNKSAINHFTRYLAKLFKNKNIRVNTLSPGGIFNNQPNTFVDSYKELSLNKGMLESKDICGALVFLLSDNSTFVNGQNIIVDDGWTL